MKLRQAANYAIDRTAMVKISGDGAPWSQILGAALKNDGKEIYPATADPEKAKALIAESGVRDADQDQVLVRRRRLAPTSRQL